MVTTRSNTRTNTSSARETEIPLAPQGGLSLHQQKKLFGAIEDAGGLFKLESTKQVLDADPRFFGTPNSPLRRQFRNRINVVKNPTNPDPEAYYSFLGLLGVKPNLSGHPRKETEDSRPLSKTDVVSEDACESPALPSADAPSSQPWSSPQLLRSTPPRQTPTSSLRHSSNRRRSSSEPMSNALVSQFAQLDMATVRFDFETDESVDADTKQRIRSKSLVP
jgi:hypothetical protein